MRRRRWRWLAVGVVVAIGLYFVGDIVLLQYLESRGAAEIARTMSAEDATVDLGGAPFLPGFFGGDLDNVSVHVRGATAAGGLRVQSVEARMATVAFDPGALYALARSSFSTKTEVKATQPLGILELGEGDLEDFLRRSIPLIGDLRVKASGLEVRFITDLDLIGEPNPDEKKMTKPARFLPRVEGGKLILRLTSVSQLNPAFRAEATRIEKLIDLPKIPGGLRTDVSLRNGVIVIEAQGADVTLEVGEGS